MQARHDLPHSSRSQFFPSVHLLPPYDLDALSKGDCCLQNFLLRNRRCPSNFFLLRLSVIPIRRLSAFDPSSAHPALPLRATPSISSVLASSAPINLSLLSDANEHFISLASLAHSPLGSARIISLQLTKINLSPLVWSLKPHPACIALAACLEPQTPSSKHCARRFCAISNLNRICGERQRICRHC